MKKLFYTLLVFLFEVVLASKKVSQQMTLVDRVVISGKNIFKDAILTLFLYMWLFVATIGTIVYGISFLASEAQFYFGISEGQKNGVIALILILNIAILLLLDKYREKRITRALSLTPVAPSQESAVSA